MRYQIIACVVVQSFVEVCDDVEEIAKFNSN